MSLLYETIVGRMGSRFSLNFMPKTNELRTSFLGRFYDRAIDISIGVKVGDVIRVLPFSSKYNHFEKVEQEISMTSLSYLCKDPELGINVDIKFITPFLPQDEMTSVTPVFIVEANITQNDAIKLRGDAISNETQEFTSGEFFIEINGEKLEVKNGILTIKDHAKVDEGIRHKKWLDKTTDAEFSLKEFTGEIGFSIENSEISENTISKKFDKPTVIETVLAAYTDEKVLKVYGDYHKFLYTKYFANIEEVVKYTWANKAELMKKTSFFESCFEESFLGKSELNLLSLAFQSFLSNTWWTNFEDKEWFSVWEGNCAYHSTIDVEYNVSPFYIMLWPQLLKMQLSAWSKAIKPGGYMPHDLGKFLVVETMEYSHDMEVEESCNFILIALAYFKVTNDIEFLKEIYPTMKTLANYIKNADTTDNGFADQGTKNTFDDAGVAVQMSKEQTYLGIKALNSYLAIIEFAKTLGDDSTVDMCQTKIEQINNTVNEKAWLGDHFAVCIDKSGKGIKASWTGEDVAENIEGCDAYSIYAVNGILYPLMCGLSIPMDMDKLRQDIKNANIKSKTRYGCKHSSDDNTGHIWMSQNIWKDMIAAYLGVDTMGMIQSYWDYQLYENRFGIGGCFVENCPSGMLNYYPRGIALIGILYAATMTTLDGKPATSGKRAIRIGKAPLLTKADWKNLKIEFTGE